MIQALQYTRESITPPSNAEQPIIYGNIPSFLGARPVRDLANLKDFDSIIAGLPWEGTNTWGSYSGCEQTPKACRLASLRYGSGYLPEFDIDVMSNLKVGDLGDLPVFSTDLAKTFKGFQDVADKVFSAGVVPVFVGGDHGVSYPILKALLEQKSGRVGIIHFDAHLDNAKEYAGDPFARCCPLRRILELPQINPTKMVHVGIRGPRNAPSQMRYALDMKTHIYSMKEIREKGFPAVVKAAKAIASSGTDGYYVTVCSDVIDFAFNPGGPLDFGGVSSSDMLEALYTLGQGPMLGLDLVEVYPRLDSREASVHLLVWLIIYSLAGMVARRMPCPNHGSKL